MRYKINNIGDEGVPVSVSVTEAFLAAECPELGARPAPKGLRLVGYIAKAGDDDYLLQGNLRGELATTCVRCLEPAVVALDVPIAVAFVESDDAGPKGTDDDEDDDKDGAGDVMTFSGGIIDLTDELRDEILLAVPFGPLCREDCAGICPVCGGNRNTSPCDCAAAQRRAGGKLGDLAKIKLS